MKLFLITLSLMMASFVAPAWSQQEITDTSSDVIATTHDGDSDPASLVDNEEQDAAGTTAADESSNTAEEAVASAPPPIALFPVHTKLPPKNEFLDLNIDPKKASIGNLLGTTGLILTSILISANFFLSSYWMYFSSEASSAKRKGNTYCSGGMTGPGVLALFLPIVLGTYYGFCTGLLIDNLALFALTAITIPSLNILAHKSKAWKYYEKHKQIDAAGWTFYSFSLISGLLATVMSVPAFNLTGICTYPEVFLAQSILSIINAAFSFTTFMLFSYKAKVTSKIAKNLKFLKDNPDLPIQYGRKRVSIAPTVSPIVSPNKGISGGTIGLAASF